MKKVDRRVKRTEKQLLDGLIALMQEKSVKNITVRELTGYVDINRSTFYLHYKDVYDMVEKLEKRMLQEFMDELNKEPKKDDVALETHRFIWVILRCIERHAPLVRVLWSEHGDIAFMKSMESMIFQQAEQWIRQECKPNTTEIQIKMMSSYFVMGCLGMIQEWLKAEEPLLLEDMAELMFHLVRNGMAEQFLIVLKD